MLRRVNFLRYKLHAYSQHTILCICVYTDISNTVCYVNSNLAGWSTRILLVLETLENSCQIHKFKKVIRELKYGYHY